MLHRKRLIPALTLVFLATLVCAPVAFGQTTTATDTPFTMTVPNSCNNDLVALSGTNHTVMSFSTNPNGMTHFIEDFNVHGSGVGAPSGVNYVYNENIHQEVNLRGNAQEQSFGTKVKLISQGNTPNMTLRMTLHVVTDSNGVPKVSMSNFQTSCN
jgi:hypothetical protein